MTKRVLGMARFPMLDSGASLSSHVGADSAPLKRSIEESTKSHESANILLERVVLVASQWGE